MRHLIALPLLAAASLSAQAVSITFSGTAVDLNGRTAAEVGYTVGQPVSFTFIFRDDGLANYAGGTDNYWDNYGNGASSVFTSASGTGITGTYNTSVGSMFNYNENNGFFDFWVNSSGMVTGFSSSNDLTLTQFAFYGAGLLVGPGAPTQDNADPSAYFIGNLGAYGEPEGQNWLGFVGGYGIDPSDYYRTYFTIDTITLAVPVPEPSTYGLILGGLALAVAAIRRRRCAGKV